MFILYSLLIRASPLPPGAPPLRPPRAMAPSPCAPQAPWGMPPPPAPSPRPRPPGLLPPSASGPAPSAPFQGQGAVRAPRRGQGQGRPQHPSSARDQQSSTFGLGVARSPWPLRPHADPKKSLSTMLPPKLPPKVQQMAAHTVKPQGGQPWGRMVR